MSVSVSIELSNAVPAVSAPGSGLPQSSSRSETPSSSLPAAQSASSAAAAEAAKPPTAAEVTSAATQVATFLSSSKTSMAFALDPTSGKMVVTITDAATGKTIRQIPSEVMLQIAQDLKQNKTVGSLQFDAKA